MERCVLFSRGTELTGEETGLNTQFAVRRESSGSFPVYDLSVQNIDLKRELDTLEGIYIDKALALTGNNLSQAAQMLGCTRFALKRRLDARDADGKSE